MYDYLKLQTNKKITFHFLMALYVKHKLIADMFQKLDEYFKLNQTNSTNSLIINIQDKTDRNFRGQLGVEYNVLIKTKQEFQHAKNLNKFYWYAIKPFLDRNKNILEKLPESFNRFYLLNGVTTSWMCGKTIHHTQSTHWVSTHYPEGNNFENVLWTPHEYGHVSHFRSSLKDLHERNISITDFKFDINYFLCYFKPMIKKLYSKNISSYN